MISPLTQAEEKELDRLYLNANTPKRKARFEVLRARLMNPVYARAYESEQRKICEQRGEGACDIVTHEPQD